MFTKRPTDQPAYPAKKDQPIPTKVKRDTLIKQMKGGC